MVTVQVAGGPQSPTRCYLTFWVNFILHRSLWWDGWSPPPAKSCWPTLMPCPEFSLYTLLSYPALLPHLCQGLSSGWSQSNPNLLGPPATGLYTWRRLADQFYPHTLLNFTFCPTKDANLLSSLPLIYRRPALSVVTFGNHFLPTPYHPLPFRCLHYHLGELSRQTFHQMLLQTTGLVCK
jgi:hypothetical protein